MKLRIKGNSLRLRVTRSELDRLISGHEIEETIYFGSSPEEILSYTLAPRSQAEPVSVHYHSQKITVFLSPEQIRAWSDENQVGVYASLNRGATSPMEVIVEKDFACLDRGDEDNADTFANPHAGRVC